MPVKVEDLTQEQKTILVDELEEILIDVNCAFDWIRKDEIWLTKDHLCQLKFYVVTRLKELRGQLKPMNYLEAIEAAKTEHDEWTF